MVENTGELQEKRENDPQALEKPLQEIQENASKLQVLPVKTEDLPVKTHTRLVSSRKVTTNVTEKEFTLYSSLAESLYKLGLIKEASMYHFLRYAAKFFTDAVLSTVASTQEKAKALQNARRANKIK